MLTVFVFVHLQEWAAFRELDTVAEYTLWDAQVKPILYQEGENHG